MRRCLPVATALFAALALSAAPAQAQFFAAAGLTVPSGDFGDYAKTGWLANAGARAWQSADERLAFWVEGFYGSSKHEDVDGDKTNIYGGLGTVTYNLTTGASATPYLTGSVGYLWHQYKSDDFPEFEDSEGGVAFGGGAGVGFDKFYVEARYLTASINEETTAFIAIVAGIVF